MRWPSSRRSDKAPWRRSPPSRRSEKGSLEKELSAFRPTEDGLGQYDHLSSCLVAPASSYACHCEPVRRLVWQSVSPVPLYPLPTSLQPPLPPAAPFLDCQKRGKEQPKAEAFGNQETHVSVDICLWSALRVVV
jgi:hypothetical protein